MLLALLVLALMAAILAAPLVARTLERRRGEAAKRRRRSLPAPIHYDPGRERRAEQRARQLLRSCVNDEEWGMYRDLGFIRVMGRQRPGARRGTDARRAAPPLAHAAPAGAGASAASPAGAQDPEAPYAYLIYPHKPILAFVPATGQLLSEYCVEFPDLTGGASRLPASDDVLAKWMALTSDESRVIARANMHLVGRQLDPARLRRDLWRLSEWERRNGSTGSIGARRA